MNPADISEILPSPEEAATRYFDPPSSKLSSDKTQSKFFPRIFFMRKSMRQLLQERSELCTSLGLSSSKKQGGIPLNRSQLAYEFSLLFPDCPQALVEYNWAIIEDRGTVYAFLSSQEKYVPLCKSCAWTVYVTLRGMKGRVACGNPKCKMKLLGEFQIGQKENKTANKVKEEKKTSRISQIDQFESKISVKQIDEMEKIMIKKAAKKAHE